jgi:hypothetical protein
MTTATARPSSAGWGGLQAVERMTLVRIVTQAVEESPAQVGDEVERFRGHRAARRDWRS